MNFRIANLDDIKGIAALYPAVTGCMGQLEPYYYKESQQSEDYIKGVITEENSDFIIAVEGDETVGFALVESLKTPPYDCFVPHGYTYIMDLVVSPAHRRRGIARALLAHAKTWAEARGSDYIELNVLSKNSGAISLYESVGFEDSAKRMRVRLK